MSRKNKTLRAFLHQNQNPTIEQAWDAAWKHAQKKFHARSMRDMVEQLDIERDYSKALEKRIAALQAECEKLRKDAERYRYIRKGNQWVVAATQTGFHVDGEDLDDLIDTEMEQKR